MLSSDQGKQNQVTLNYKVMTGIYYLFYLYLFICYSRPVWFKPGMCVLESLHNFLTFHQANLGSLSKLRKTSC